jgi:hypothetical protein
MVRVREVGRQGMLGLRWKTLEIGDVGWLALGQEQQEEQVQQIGGFL